MSTRRSVARLDAAQTRQILGLARGPVPDDHADTVPEHFDVDATTTDLAGDGHLLTVGDCAVIVAAKSDSWFRQSFTIAHEFGHLAQESLCDGQLKAKDGEEARANRFAVDLFPPDGQVRAINWDTITLAILAQRIWDWGHRRRRWPTDWTRWALRSRTSSPTN